MSETDKVLKELNELEKTIKKSVAELTKKPGDAKHIKAIQTSMTEAKKFEAKYAAAEVADRKVFDAALKGLGG